MSHTYTPMTIHSLFPTLPGCLLTGLKKNHSASIAHSGSLIYPLIHSVSILRALSVCPHFR